MDINIDVNCLKCNNPLENPYTCKNCRANFCQECIEKSCFKCKNSTEFEENIQLKRIVEGMILVCKYCKSEIGTKNELKEHIQKQKCPVKIFLCNVCKKYNTDDQKEFWNHIKNKHHKEIIKTFGN
jgi:hypothetical protein